MGYRNSVVSLVERWSPVAFLVAGGLFVLPAVADGIEVVTGTEIAMSPAVVFASLGVVFVGLLGLYPQLAERDSPLTTGAVYLLAATTAILLPAIWVFLPSTGYPVGEAAALAIVVSVALGSTLTVAVFGVAILRTSTHSRSIGRLLLVIAASLSGMLVVMVIYGHSTPDWVGFVVNGLVAISSGSIGHVLRTADVVTETPDSTGDVLTG